MEASPLSIVSQQYTLMGIFDKTPTEIHIKTVMLGYCFAGKTSFPARFIHKRFYKTEAAIGAAFVSKKIEALGKRVTLNIWDTDGSEQYQPMTKIYYRDCK
nr:ras-related protein Rab-24-like [Crassostrea gigas]